MGNVPVGEYPQEVHSDGNDDNLEYFGSTVRSQMIWLNVCAGRWLV